MTAQDISNFLSNNINFTVDDIIVEIGRHDALKYNTYMTNLKCDVISAFYCREGIVLVKMVDKECSRIISKKQLQFEEEISEIINAI